MLEQLNKVIAVRIKEVLQFHLNGTEEEYQLATNAVMDELTNMGGILEAQFYSGDLSMQNESDREALAKHLAETLTSND